MREDAMCELLSSARQGWELVEKMMAQDKLVELDFDGQKFYMRKLYEGYHR